MRDVATNVIIREWVLGETFMVTGCMVLVFMIFVVMRAKDLRYQIFTSEFYGSKWTRASIGLITFMTGVSLRAGWVWALLWSYERNGITNGVTSYWPLDIVAGALTIIGGLCVIREFTPDDWNYWPFWRRPWMLSLEVTFSFLVVVHFVI